MVRGNWQKRVETAEARRKTAKQRKQRTENTRLHKQWTVNFLDVLDRHCDRLANTHCKLKIWSDVAPGGGGKAKEQVVGEAVGKALDSGKKAKSQGVASSKKKAHPRSKEATTHDNEMEEPHQWMCRSYFFTGKCSESKGGGKKSAGCRYIHENAQEEESSNHYQQQQTLFQALSRCKDAKNQLKEANEAVKTYMLSSDDLTATEHPGAMDAMFFVGEVEENSLSLLEVGDDGSAWSPQITELLAKKQLKLSSVMYFVLNDVLVFDRYREGSMFETDRDFLIAILGEESVRSRRESVGNETNAAKLQELPGSILEHILTFLPDEAVASSSQVCKAWHYEIGKNSPNLWRHLLDRRCWPHPLLEESEESSLESHHYREQFVEHSLVMRDVNAVRSGLHAIADQRRGRRPQVTEKEMVFQHFSFQRRDPSHRNDCIDIYEWSPNRVLAAYSDDSSLRLFEAVPKAGSGGEKLCREQICVKVNPYENTKKRQSRLVSVGLDEEYIGCLCQIQTDKGTDDGHGSAHKLVIVSRSDFLLGESLTDGNAESFHIYDVTESLLNFVVSEGRDDDKFDVLFDFLSRGGELDKVLVSVSHKLIACGSGMLMMMTRISVPRDDDEVSSRFYALFSVHTGAIVMMAHFRATDGSLPDYLSFSHLRHSSQRDVGTSVCSIAVSSIGRSIEIFELTRSEEVQILNIPYKPPFPSNGEFQFRGEAERPHWRRYPLSTDADGGSLPIVVTATEVVCSDSFYFVRGAEPIEEILKTQITLSFFPWRSFVDNSDDATIHKSIIFRGNVKISRMALIRQHHIILLCLGPEGEQNGTFLPEEPGPGDRERSNESLFAIVVHVPTRREIGRVNLLDWKSLEFEAHIPRFAMSYSQTVAVGWDCIGIVMTGNDVRSVSGRDNTAHKELPLPSKAHKRKKKRQPNQGEKKDGFARGMSSRG